MKWNARRPLGQLRHTAKDGVAKTVTVVAESYNVILNWKNNNEFSNWLTKHFSDQHATVASKAMDEKYIENHIGGGWHRPFDGGHTLSGSWDAVGKALPDLGALDRLGVWANEYWKDLITTRGMPIIVLDHAEQISEYFKHLDCVNVAQLIGGEVFGVSIYCNWNDPAKLVASSTAVECTGVVYANVVAPLVGLIGIGRAYFLLRKSEQKALKSLIAPALKGLTRSGASILVISVVPGGFLLHLSSGIIICLAHNYIWEKGAENKRTIVAAMKKCFERLQVEQEHPEPIVLLTHPPSARR
jgi:hypothetical protein